jgi:hypothetical protein
MTGNSLWRTCGAVFTVFALSTVVSAKEPLVTDRPDFTESSSSVGSGALQLESGVTYSDFRNGTGNASGFLSSGVGFKYELAQGDGSGFLGGVEAALIASTTIPTGTSDFASSKWQPSAVFAASWELGPNVGIGTNVGIGRPADDENRYTTLWASVAVGVGLNEASSLFFELYGFNREDNRGPSTGTFQTGLTYLFSPDLQADVRVARRLTDRGVDFLVGAGLSLRLGG